MEFGGYFEIELNDFGSVFHNQAIAFNSGRNAFEYILLQKGYNRVHIPYFTCEVLLEPLVRNNIEYLFYHINDAFLPIDLNLSDGDAILYTNYFGINQKAVGKVIDTYKNVIIDNAQAFFDLPISNTETFYSPRKFFGLPDGGFAYASESKNLNNLEKDKSIGRMEHLLMRIENGAESGYLTFKENDKKLSDQTIKGMSNITQRLLKNIHFNKVAKSRLDNFKFLHYYFKPLNKLSSLIDSTNCIGPLVYPLWVENAQFLRDKLLQNKIYTATYWPNVLNWTAPDSLESDFTKNIVCLPIDQRITQSNLTSIIEIIKEA